MQLKTFGESLFAGESIKNVLSTYSEDIAEGRNLILVKQELRKATSNYSTEAVKAAIAESTLNEAQIRAILTKKGLKGEILETTTAELANAASANAVAAAEGTATTATVGFGNSVKGLGVALKNLVIAHPIVAAIAVVGTAIALYAQFGNTLKNLQKKAKESKQEYDDVTTEIKNLNDELKTTKDRIEELQNKDVLTVIEQEELDKLKESNDELERELRIKEAIAQRKGQDAADKAEDAITKKSESYNGHYAINDPDMTLQDNPYVYDKGDRIDAANWDIEQAKQNNQELEALYEKRREIEEKYNNDASQFTNDKEWKNNEKNIESKKAYIESVEDSASAYIKALMDEDDALYDSNGKIIKGKEELVNKLLDLYKKFDEYNNTETPDDKEVFDKYYNDTINRFKTNEESNLDELKKSYQEAIDKRKDLYSGTDYVGNVDINNRPVVTNDDGSYSTTSTSFQEKWIGDEENGHYIIAHFTPILPDGTVLDENSLNEYIDKILNSDDPMEADKVKNGGKGIVYKVDTQINGKDITDDNLEDAFGVADAWDVDMHNLQDKMYKDEAAIKAQIAKFDDGVDGSQKIKNFFDTNGIKTQDDLNQFNEVTKGINNADEAIKKWIEHKKEANNTTFTKDPTDLLRDADDTDRKDTNINLADLKNRADVMKTIQKEMEESGAIGVDTMQTLSKQFPEAKEALYDYMTGIKNEAELFSDLENKYDEDKQKYVENMVEKNQANEDFFNSLKANYPETFAEIQNFMNQGNELLEQTKNNYINSIIVEEESCDAFLSFIEQTYPELYRQLAEVYDNDKENFIRHLFSENESNQEFIQAISTMYPELANALSTVYQNDVSNWTSMEQAKVNISAQAIQKIAQLYKNFYEAMGVSNRLEFIENVNKKVSSDPIAHYATNPLNTLYNEETFDKIAKENVPEYSELINNIDGVISDMQNEKNSLSKIAADQIDSHMDLSYNGLGKDTDSSSKDKDGSDSDSDKQTEEDFDWIERVVKKIERTISNLGSVVDDTYSAWSERNNALLSELNAVSEEIGIQERAAQKYFELADSVGLDENYKNLIQNGDFNVETITDDDLKERINNYKDYYDKATDAQDKVTELRQTYNDLNNQRLDHLTSEFEQLNNATDRAIQNSQNILDDDYANYDVKEAEINNQKNNYLNSLDLKQQERQILIDEFNATGIDINSEAGYKWLTSLQSIDDEIVDIHKNLNSLNGTKLDFITSQFERLDNDIDRVIQKSQNILDDSHISYYVKDDEINNQREKYLNSLALKEQEYQRITNEFSASGIDVNSDAGQDWLTKIREIEDEINNLQGKLKDLNDTSFDNLSNEFKNTYQWIEELNNIWKDKVDDSFSSWTDRDNAITNLKETIQQQIDKYNQYRNQVMQAFQEAQENGDSEAAQKYYSEIFSIDSALRSLRQDYNSAATTVLDHSVSEFEQKYNYIETVMKNTENIMNDDTKSYATRNRALIDQISNVTTAIAQQQEQRNKLVKEFDESGIEPNTEEWYKWLQQVQSCDDTIRDLQEQSRTLNKQRFDDIKTQFENLNTAISNSVNILEKYISIAETKGLFVDASLYSNSINIQQTQLNNLINEKQKLEAEMKNAVNSGVDQSSESFLSMESNIADVNSSILDTINSIEELKKSIRELDFSKFEYLQDRISNVSSEANYYIDLIDKMGKDLYTDEGNITKEGVTTAALHLQNKDVYLKQAQEYANKIKEIEEQIANNPTNKDLLDKKQEYIEAQREAYLSAMDEKKSIEDLVKDGYQKQLDYIQKIIDKKKEQMDEESDAYEYQKSIAEKTANLNKLYKQRTALTQMNDDSEENLKKIQELKVSIEDAEKDLQETEYEKMKSDRQKQLDNLQDEFSDMIDNMTENIDENLNGIINEVNSSSVAIINTLKELSGNSGLDLSDTISSIYNNGSSYSNLNTNVSAIGQNYSKTNDAMQNLETSVKNLISNMEKESTQKQYGIDVDTSLTNKIDEVNNTVKDTISAVGSLNNTINKVNDGTLNNINDSIKNLDNTLNNKITSEDIGTPIRKNSPNDIGTPIQKTITETRINIPSLKNYANGTQNSPVDYAWTQEDGAEIIRTKDGAILTPVGIGGMVFTNEMSKNLYNLAKGGLTNNVNTISTPSPTFMTNNNTSSPNISYSIDIGDVKLEGVNNPQEFAQQLRYAVAHDLKTQRILKAATTDQLAGKSAKEVYKYV